MRINRFLAAAGLGSRRSVEELIRDGMVTINGATCLSLATEVSETDHVKVRNRLIHPEAKTYMVLHKPRNYLCTRADEIGRRTIYELLPPDGPKVVSVGRLDKESEGLLLLTNDGDMNLRLTHPRFKMEKEYDVQLDRPFQPEHRDKLLKGFHIEGGRGKFERLSIRNPRLISVVLKQGIKRQIRLMLYQLGYEVKVLRRIRFGPIRLGTLPIGSVRWLRPAEIEGLRVAPAAPKVDASETPKPMRSLRKPSGKSGGAKPGDRRTPGSRPRSDRAAAGARKPVAHRKSREM